MKTIPPEEKLLQLIKSHDPFARESVQKERVPFLDEKKTELQQKRKGKKNFFFVWGLILCVSFIFIIFSIVFFEKKESKPFDFKVEKLRQKKVQSKEFKAKKEISPPKDLKLVGIIQGEEPTVVIEDLNLKANLTLSLGEHWKHFSLTKIGKGTVYFESEEEVFTLQL